MTINNSQHGKQRMRLDDQKSSLTLKQDEDDLNIDDDIKLDIKLNNVKNYEEQNVIRVSMGQVHP